MLRGFFATLCYPIRLLASHFRGLFPPPLLFIVLFRFRFLKSFLVFPMHFLGQCVVPCVSTLLVLHPLSARLFFLGALLSPLLLPSGCVCCLVPCFGFLGISVLRLLDSACILSLLFEFLFFFFSVRFLFSVIFPSLLFWYARSSCFPRHVWVLLRLWGCFLRFLLVLHLFFALWSSLFHMWHFGLILAVFLSGSQSFVSLPVSSLWSSSSFFSKSYTSGGSSLCPPPVLFHAAISP